jgi:hypothetical protein
MTDDEAKEGADDLLVFYEEKKRLPANVEEFDAWMNEGFRPRESRCLVHRAPQSTAAQPIPHGQSRPLCGETAVFSHHIGPAPLVSRNRNVVFKFAWVAPGEKTLQAKLPGQTRVQ